MSFTGKTAREKWEDWYETLTGDNNYTYSSKRRNTSLEKSVIIQLMDVAWKEQIEPEEVAQKLGCSYQNVWQFFTGKHGVSLVSVERMAAVLGKLVKVDLVPSVKK